MALVNLERLNARDGFRSGIEMMQQSARLMGVMPGSGLFCDWRELDNKFEAFRLFQYADRELKEPVDRLPIDDAVRRAHPRETFQTIGRIEDIGHTQATAASLSVEGLLSEGAGASLPDRAL